MNIQEYLQKVLDLLLLENYEIESSEDDEKITLKIILSEEDSGILIGYHGETLSAIQRLLRTTFTTQLAEKRIVVNINDYRDQREEKVRTMIEKGIAKILATGGKYHLYRLNSAERFFAHKLINEEERFVDFTSYSVDDEDGERVLIIDCKTDATASL